MKDVGGSPAEGERRKGEEDAVVNTLNALVVRAQNAWFRMRDEESGQTLVEYGLIIALIALACVAALGFLSGKIQDLFSKTGNQLNNAA